MNFYQVRLNAIKSDKDFRAKVTGEVRGASRVTGTLSYVFNPNYMWGVSNAGATVTGAHEELVGRNSINGSATVSGTLTTA